MQQQRMLGRDHMAVSEEVLNSAS